MAQQINQPNTILQFSKNITSQQEVDTCFKELKAKCDHLLKGTLPFNGTLEALDRYCHALLGKSLKICKTEFNRLKNSSG